MDLKFLRPALALICATEFTLSSAFAASGTPLPAGNIRRMLHLGAAESDRITGFPTSALNILWDNMVFAGKGPEYLQQPSPGQSVDLRVAVNGTANTVLTWSDVTAVNPNGVWENGVADNYVMYWAIYIYAPTTRTARVAVTVDDYAKVWMDGNSTPIILTPADTSTTADVNLTAGWHFFICKMWELTGNDYFSIKFTDTNNADMTDLQYTLTDPIAPAVASTSPASAQANVPAWSDVIFTFSEPMDTTVDPNTVGSITGGPANGTWYWADNTNLIWIASAPLAPNTAYTATVNAASAKDRTGNTLTGSNSVSFTTVAAISSPTLTSATPNTSAPFAAHVALAGTGFIRGGVKHAPTAVPFQGHYYSYRAPGIDWASAVSIAAGEGGHLATIANAQEDNYVWTLGGMINGWIGLTEINSPGTYKWITGEPTTYTNWASGEPSFGGEHYGIYWYGLQWNDVDSAAGSVRPYVIEYETQSVPVVKLSHAGQADIVAANVTYIDGNNLAFDLNLTGAVDGAWDLVLTNPDGGTVTLPGGFTVSSSIAVAGLTIYYPFDESSGTSTADLSGNGNNGTLFNNPARTADFTLTPNKYALQFNGANQQTVSSNTLFNNPQIFTLVLWFNTTTTTGGKLIGFGNTQSGSSSLFDRHIYMANSGQLLMGCYTGGAMSTITSPAAYNDGRWHLVASVLSNSGMQLFVDGVLVASNATTAAQVFSGYWRIGGDSLGSWPNRSSSDFFTGTIDDVRIFNRGLSASEIQALLQLQLPSATADFYGAIPGQTLSVAAPGILSNDNNGFPGSLTAILDNTTAHGNLALNANGSFAYTPTAGYSGTDTFTYHATNGKGQTSGTATVLIQVSNQLPGLVGYYSFDEPGGTTAQDYSGNGNTGTLIGNPARVPGLIGNSLLFDGSTTYVSIPHSSSIDPITGWTLAAFIKRSAMNTQHSIIEGYGSSGGNYAMRIGDTNVLQTYLLNYPNYSQLLSGTSTIYSGQWYHVAVTYDASLNQLKTYVNGNFDTSATTAFPSAHANAPVFIGARGTDAATKFAGNIDDVRVYSRALTAAEIKGLASLPPVAAADFFSTPIGTQLSMTAPGVLANDTDPLNLVKTAVLDSTTSHGTLTLNANGSFIYAPAGNYTGSDSFTYHTVNANGLASSVVTATINVENLSVVSTSPVSGVVSQTLPGVAINGSGFRMSGLPTASGAVAFNGHNYLYVNSTMTWPAAESYCEGLSGHLVTISSGAENAFVLSLANTVTWLGASDPAATGNFAWVTGEPFSYTNWYPGEPNNLGGAEFYLQQYTNGQWNNIGATTLPFVCEFESVPTSVKLQLGALVIQGTNVHLSSTAQLTADFNLAGAVPGAWDVIVTDHDSAQSATLPGGFQVLQASTLVTAGNVTPITYSTSAQNIFVSAQVTPQYGALYEGTVTFQLASGNTNIGNAVTSPTLANDATGNVTYVVPAGIPAGIYTLSAKYNGTTNYSVSTDSSKSLTINPAALSVTASNASRAYGAANPTLTGTLVGAQAGDGISATFSTNATVLSPVGNYTIVPALLDPNNRLANYTVTSTNGTLTVTKAPLTVAAFNAVRNYGAANQVFSGTVLGVQNGDNILATYSSQATPATVVGLYPIVPSIYDPDGKLSNYSFALSNGALTILPAPLTVVAADASRPFGASNPVLIGTITGIANNDNITATYSTTATPSSPVNTYPIVPALVDPDNKLGNYSVTLTNGTLTVTGQAQLIVTPANVTIKYGDAIPALTGTLSGVQNGDNITATYSTTAAPGSPVGFYSIVATLNDPDNKLPAYAVTLNTSTLTINPAPLSVKADDKSRTYGQANPQFTGTLSGVLNGDAIAAVFSSSAAQSSTAGKYPIVATLNDPGGKLGNYTLSSTNGTLTIQQATPVLTWPAPARIFAGVALGQTQLSASAADPNSNAPISGTFAYTPAAGALLSAGLGQTLSVVFTPSDAVDYTTASAQTSIDVDPTIAPAITSALSATTANNAAFAYTITATGSPGPTFSAAGLPAGLALNGADITGAPTASGIFNVMLAATNAAGSDSEVLKLTVIGSGTNHAPVIASPPTVSANPAVVCTALSFAAQATDADGDALDYAWDFGDGTVADGASVSKIFAAPGVYVVTVAVSDGQASAMQSVDLVVNAQASQDSFAVTKIKLGFSFVKSGRDNLSLSGQIPLPPGFAPAGKVVRILIGGFDTSVTLDAKGTSGDKSFSVRSKKGSSTASYSFAVKNRNLFASLQGLGFSKTASNPVLNFPVIVELDGASHFTNPTLVYTVKVNKLGPQSASGRH